MRENNKISGAQMKMLWGVARRQGLDSDMLHDRARRDHGVDSLKELSSAQAARLIDALLGKPPASIYRASQAQVGMILGLAAKLGWDDPRRLQGWLRSRWGVDRPEWLSSYDARTCIDTMKAMHRGGRGERKGYQKAE
jgi:hypothetical protein